MFKFFKKHPRVEVHGNTILIDNSKNNIGKAIEFNTVFKLTSKTPVIKVFENLNLVRQYRIDALNENPNLTGQFFHSSIRVLENGGVMIDGVISKSNISHPVLTDEGFEGIRLQPFFLSDSDDKNDQLIGKGLFERGLHFSGTITPTTVRCICVCDKCNRSFSLQHFHAGFAEIQYFYSTYSQETLIVSYNDIVNMPTQLQERVDITKLIEVENKLPKSFDGEFLYYNSFKCPHCLAPFIDFKKYKDIRPQEYYGNTLINNVPKRWTY